MNMSILIRIVLSIGSVLLLNQVSFAEAGQHSPIGYWKTIDDVSGEPKSIVKITYSEAGTLSGSVVKLFKEPHKVCEACEGEEHNKPIVGMVIMKQLVPSKDNSSEWANGQILDPKNGKIYNCLIKLTEDGQKLKVRGYIGFPLFGRSQTWEKVEAQREIE
jgi:uncharacterized protein (DUF2147 family)